ncbi:hypothetical protein D3C85_1584580 [compost metagenome]
MYRKVKCGKITSFSNGYLHTGESSTSVISYYHEVDKEEVIEKIDGSVPNGRKMEKNVEY